MEQLKAQQTEQKAPPKKVHGMSDKQLHAQIEIAEAVLDGYTPPLVSTGAPCPPERGRSG